MRKKREEKRIEKQRERRYRHTAVAGREPRAQEPVHSCDSESREGKIGGIWAVVKVSSTRFHCLGCGLEVMNVDQLAKVAYYI